MAKRVGLSVACRGGETELNEFGAAKRGGEEERRDSCKRASGHPRTRGSPARAETLVLVHGFGGDQTVWNKILPCLSRHFRVLLFDWGLLRSCLGARRLRWPLASVKWPDLIKRLILLGASPRYITTDSYKGELGTAQIDQIISSIESHYYGWAPNFASVVVSPHDALSIEVFAKCLRSMRPEAALPVARAVFLRDHRDVLGE
ncbi:hypothetical protein NL676_035672 [Syzygium grande]|nr:hypothetical protein NL676_035672 [Syzygium grande]